MELYVFGIGITIGSFLNVLVDRIETGESVLWGRSHCDFCKKTLRWFELIPLFSFILQRGKCVRCKKSLSMQYPLMELVTGLSYVILLQYIPFSAAYFWSLGILSAGIVITAADLKYQIIPDSMVLLGIGTTLGFLYANSQMNELPIRLICMTLSAAIFYSLWFFTKGKGMGFGDVKLSAALGLLTGFPGTIFALYCAFLTGAALGVILILTKNKTIKSKIAFGPFLIFGILIALMFHTQLLSLWKIYF